MIVRSGLFRGVNPFSSLISSGVILLFVSFVLVFPARSTDWIDAARNICDLLFSTGGMSVYRADFLFSFLPFSISKYGAIPPR